MALRLITGSANANITGYAHAQLRRRACSRTPSLLLVPSAPDVSRALEQLASDIPLGLAVRTFTDYLDLLWMARGDGRQIVTPVQRIAVLAESVRSWDTSLPRESTESRGVIRSLSGLVQRAAESPRAEAGTAATKGVGGDLLACVAVYYRLLVEAGFIERAEAHRHALDRLDSLELPGLIVVDHFTGLTPAQERFVTTAARTTDVVVCLTFDPGTPATLAAQGLVERLSRCVGAEHLALPPEAARPTELEFLERHLGGLPPRAVHTSGAVIFSEAWGPAAEAARIVREIQDAVCAQIPPERIAVVFREVAPHMRDLQPALADAGIAAEFDVKLPFQTTSLGKTILTLLAFGSGGSTYPAVMDALRSPFSPAPDEVLDALDADVRGAGSRDARAIERWLGSRHPESARFLRDARRACRDGVGSAAERGWYRTISAMLSRSRPGSSSTESDALADAAVARVFIDAVRGMGALQGRAVSPQVLAAALQETSVTVGQQGTEGRVQVMGAERVRGGEYECLILGGLTAGEFPRPLREDALSSPGIVGVLASAGIDPPPRGGVADERLLFYQVVTRATRRLVLSWQSHDANGQSVRPSLFLEEVLDLYRDPSSGSFHADRPPHHMLGLDSLADHEGGPRTLRRTLRSAVANGEESPDEALSSLRDAGRRALRPPPAASLRVREVMSEREVFSASEIEAYLQCPYRWYIERLVRPRELDERIDSAAAGRIAHDIMYRFYEEFITRTGHRRVTPETLDAARAIHEDVAATALQGVRETTASEAAAIRATSRRTTYLVEADATLLPGFEPSHREWSFGLAEGDMPEPLGGFSLVGRVDRIDTDASRLVVTDYKLGAVDSRRGVGGFETEGLVQLPLYAVVASRRLGLAVAGGLYRSVRDSKPRGFVREDVASGAFVSTDFVEAKAIDACIDSAIERATESVGRMRAGDIRAEPRSGVCPSYCFARAFCAEWSGGNARA